MKKKFQCKGHTKTFQSMDDKLYKKILNEKKFNIEHE